MTTIDLLSTPNLPAPIARRPRQVSGRYDSAQTTPENQMHWRWADDMSARAAHSPMVRQILRRRSRYEVANNSFLKGMVRTLADYVVGTGPTINLLTDDIEFNAAVAEKFAEHCSRIKLARKLHLMRMAKVQDGESIGIITNNGGLRGQVKVDLRLVEAEQMTAMAASLPSPTADDGVFFDDWGNVLGYRILRYHPGDLGTTGVFGDADTYPASYVCHLFNQDRPGQTRGVPETTPALPLFAMLRRFTIATVLSAETAARFAGVIRTNAPPAAGHAEAGEPFDILDMPYNQLLTLPDGWDISQLRSEHPGTTHEMFKRAVITEAARCLSMPYAVAVGDASNHNFASGKLDYGAWNKSLVVDQDQVEDVVVEPLFVEWYNEASRITDFLPPAPTPGIPKHSFLWDGQEFIDPREAGARDIGLRNGADTLPRLYAKRGLDMTAEQTAMAKSLGMTLDEYRAAVRNNLFPPQGAAKPAQPPADSTDQTPAQEELANAA